MGKESIKVLAQNIEPKESISCVVSMLSYDYVRHLFAFVLGYILFFFMFPDQASKMKAGLHCLFIYLFILEKEAFEMYLH